MNDMVSSFKDWFKEKTTSPLYFTYIFFLIFWNWKIIYVLFGEDSSLFKTPKIEYISTFLNFHFEYPIIEWIVNTLWHIIPPILLTWIAINYLPKIYNWAHIIHLKNYFERKERFDDEELEYQKRRTLRLKTVAIQKEQQKTQIQRIERTQTKEEKWLKEFEEISKDRQYIEAMRAAHNAVYKTNGVYTVMSHMQNGYETYVSPEYLSKLDVLGIIEISSQKINFTEKGKFFIKMLQRQKNIFNYEDFS